MARLVELKNIAAGLHGSFISRNNDVDGYWGIGKLRSLAQRDGIGEVHIDLLGRIITPYDAQYSKMLEFYASYLRCRLNAAGFSESAVVHASITLEFECEAGSKPLYKLSPGDVFKLSVELGTADRRFSVTGFGHCEPHNPYKFSRAVRR